MAYLNEEGVQQLISDIKTYQVAKPASSPNGSSGQHLISNGDGTTRWADAGTPTDAQTTAAITAWLDAHPEATTTVTDGSITKAKLATALAELIDAIPDLQDLLEAVHRAGLTVYNGSFYVNPDGNT